MVKTSRYLKVGPGGMNCACCSPRSKDRRKQWRSAKRKADREAIKNALVDLEDDNWMQLEDDAKAYEDAYGPNGTIFDELHDDWKNEPDEEDFFTNDDDDLYDDDPYSCYDDDYDNAYYYNRQSEQEKVARALSVSLTGVEDYWCNYLNNAKTFIEEMEKRNDQ